MSRSIILLLLVIGLPSLVFSQSVDTLRIGIKDAPPFVMMDGNEPTGLSIQFWQLLNQEGQYEYTFVPYENIAQLVDAVESGEVDFSINPVTVSESRLETMDFSQPYFIAETTFVKRQESRIINFLSSLFSWKFFSAVAVLLLIIFIFGLLVWVFERRGKNEQFKRSARGIADGFWWSAVTMTTVGYGDKAPVSPGGRFIAFIWMFTSIVLISGLTAGIASALTVQSINENIESLADLGRFKTLTVAKSSANEFLDYYQVRHQTVPSLAEALEQLKNGQTDVVVYDKPILNHRIQELGYQDDLSVSDRGFKTDYYSFTFPKKSPYYYPINKLLVGKLKSQDWDRIKEGIE